MRDTMQTMNTIFPTPHGDMSIPGLLASLGIADPTISEILRKSSTEFIADVINMQSHELNNPISSAVGYSEMLVDEFGKEYQPLREAMDLIVEANNKFLGLRKPHDFKRLQQLEGELALDVEGYSEPPLDLSALDTLLCDKRNLHEYQRSNYGLLHWISSVMLENIEKPLACALSLAQTLEATRKNEREDGKTEMLYLSTVKRNLSRIDDRVKSLRRYTNIRKAVLGNEAYSPKQLLEEVIASLPSEYKVANLIFDATSSDRQHYGNPEMIQTTLRCIMENGIDAALLRQQSANDTKNIATLAISYETDSEGSHITIRDNGGGLLNAGNPHLTRGVTSTSRIYDTLMTPFFSTKSKNTLTQEECKLANAFASIVHHGGYIEAVSQEGEGMTFTIHLPYIVLQ